MSDRRQHRGRRCGPALQETGRSISRSKTTRGHGEEQEEAEEEEAVEEAAATVEEAEVEVEASVEEELAENSDS